jgi:hypothetical protein
MLFYFEKNSETPQTPNVASFKKKGPFEHEWLPVFEWLPELPVLRICKDV